MSEIVRNAIEKRERIKQELVLMQEDFLLNEDLAVLKTPTPPPRQTEVEPTMPDTFTVAQLKSLFAQFTTTAPTGVMSVKSFMETFENMVAVTHGMEQLPDVWLNISQTQIQDIANGASADGEYVDWRRFLIALAQPIPAPSQSELLETLTRFREMDQKSTGFVTREQYDRMDLWFRTEGDVGTFDRMTTLKEALFDIFADHNRIPPVLDYIGMLLYFSAAPKAQEGFFRALSVSSGTHMPRLIKPKPKQEPPSISPELTEEEEPAPPTPPPEDIPAEAADAAPPLDALYRVLHHGESAKGDSHRFSVAADPEDATSMERLLSVYQELGGDESSAVALKILLDHPLIQDVVQGNRTFKALDLKAILSSGDNTDAHSTKTMD